MRRNLAFWLGAAIFIAIAVTMAVVVRNEHVFFACYVILQFVVLATAWNILGGYAGYVNFGTSAFFGIGVYTAVFLYKLTGVPLLVQMLAAATVGAALGFGLGLVTLRLRGIFFSIATVAATIIAETLMTNWKYVGGATGVQVLRPPVTAPFDSYIKMLFVVAAILVVIAIALARYVQNSKIHAWCQWCLASDVILALLAVLTSWRLLRATPPDVAAPSATSG